MECGRVTTNKTNNPKMAGSRNRSEMEVALSGFKAELLAGEGGWFAPGTEVLASIAIRKVKLPLSYPQKENVTAGGTKPNES